MKTIAAAFERLVDRHGGYLELGPIYLTSRMHANSDNRNAFQLGRDYERAQQLEAR